MNNNGLTKAGEVKYKIGRHKVSEVLDSGGNVVGFTVVGAGARVFETLESAIAEAHRLYEVSQESTLGG